MRKHNAGRTVTLIFIKDLVKYAFGRT
jgi:hypothetical protein